MTKFEVRNNMAYASQMQFEVLRRALWVQQAQPQTVFDWKDNRICEHRGYAVHCSPCENRAGLCSRTVDQHLHWTCYTESDLFPCHPHHQVLLSCKPHRPGCHQRRPAQTTLAEEVRELNADVIVECYLDAKYYHYDPANVANLLEDDNIVTVENAETDEYNLSPSISDNFKELESACPEWQPDTQAVHPKWLEHHQSGHLTKDKNCPVCVEEAGSRVAHWQKKGDRQTGVMHVDLAAFEPSADGNKHCLVAAVTIEVDKESKLLPI